MLAPRRPLRFISISGETKDMGLHDPSSSSSTSYRAASRQKNMLGEYTTNLDTRTRFWSCMSTNRPARCLFPPRHKFITVETACYHSFHSKIRAEFHPRATLPVQQPGSEFRAPFVQGSSMMIRSGSTIATSAIRGILSRPSNPTADVDQHRTRSPVRPKIDQEEGFVGWAMVYQIIILHA